ncbi:MAG: LysR substrate-binding domain-containing protein [Janthinobacterium lividum]
MNPLDPILLRSFLAVAGTLRFTAAARQLCLSQSTVSEHVGRLERVVGRSLLLRSTRQVALTTDGAAMVDFAREIIAAHDRALAYFDPSVLRGPLRFGISEDLVLSRLPEILRTFRLDHPLVDLDLHVGLSSDLHALLDAGGLDLIFTKRMSADPCGVTIWQERLIWIGSPDLLLDPVQPVPLVLFPGASITRKAAIETLNEQGRHWHLAFSSDSLSALLAALRAGFGVSAQSAILAGSGLVVVPEHAGLPLLPIVDIVVLGRSNRFDGPIAALVAAISEGSAQLRHQLEPADPTCMLQ